MSLKFATDVIGSTTNESFITICLKCSVPCSPANPPIKFSFNPDGSRVAPDASVALYANPKIEPSDTGNLTSCVTNSASTSLGF